MNLILKVFGWVVSKMAAPFAIFWAGGKHKELKNTQEVIKNVKKAKDAQDRITFDDEYRDRVRDKFK